MNDIPHSPLTPSQHQGHSAFATTLALLLLRFALGYVMFFHGSQKLFSWFGGRGIENFANFLATQPLPLLSPTAWALIAAISEFLGGIFIILGLLTRLATLPTIATMVVAILTVTGKNGFDSQSKGYEYNLVLIAMASALLLAGPGLVSADAFLFRRSLWARGPQPLENPGKREQPAPAPPTPQTSSQ